MDLCTNMAIIHQGQSAVSGETGDRNCRVARDASGSVPSRKLSCPLTNRAIQIISNRLVGGRPFLHVLSEAPLDGGFSPSRPDLEDVFFTKIRGWN